MADTYIVRADNVFLSATNRLLFLSNGVGSTDILKITRIYILNNQVGVAAATGAINELLLTRASSAVSGTKIFPQKLHSSAANLHANVFAGISTSHSYSTTPFRRIFFSGDEPAQNELNSDTLGLIPNFNLIWDSGYNSTIIEPLVLNAGEAFGIVNINGTSNFLGTIVMEFTK